MGVAISDWRLARAVAEIGQMGVVSGTALDIVMVRRLQAGDHDGSIRQALAALPLTGVAERLIDRYFVAGGKASDERFVKISMKRDRPSRSVAELLVASSFVEVFLAKRGHVGMVGINLLEKLQAATLPTIYGAMLAGVDVVLMGAGIPKAIPVVLDELAKGCPVDLKLDVAGSTADDDFRARFDPGELFDGEPPMTARPMFLAIVASHTLAVMLARKLDVPVDGFVVEGPIAGGHNAPPRGKLTLDDEGQPIYGDRDVPDLEVIRGLGLPFWLAGGFSTAEQVAGALASGAAGVQVGTPFAFCAESGFDETIKRQVIEEIANGTIRVRTDPLASPSGFPFKVLELAGTLSEAEVLNDRERVPCELGYLRTAYKDPAGRLAWRCPAEPVDEYVRKGGDSADTNGRMCLCNGLVASAGFAQVAGNGTAEPNLVTCGSDVGTIERLLIDGRRHYTAHDVVDQLLPPSQADGDDLRVAGQEP